MSGRDVGEGELMWSPDTEAIHRSHLTDFCRWLGRDFADYAQLWRWSVEDIDGFWSAVWDYFGVLGERPDGPVRAGEDPMGTIWFPGTRLNYTDNVLHRAGVAAEHVRIVAVNERGERRTMTHAELVEAVGRAAAGLRALGVGPGDRVAGYLPNIAETVIAFLATASIGAIWSCCAPDFGVRSVVDRLRQIEPAVLIAADGYLYGGQAFDRREQISQIVAALPSVRKTVVVPYLAPARDGEFSWPEMLRPASDSFTSVDFDHPLWIVYSSGTTGLPKAIVHGHGGIVLEHLKALTFHHDIGPDDTFFWFTTTGWMMWNYLVGALHTGAAIVLYDGSPTWPNFSTLWEFAAREQVTFFGTSAPFLTACAKRELQPGKRYDLSALRAIGSTGSALPPSAYGWAYENVRADMNLGSFSGGTDLCTGFLGPAPWLPVRAGVLSCAMLGAKAEAYDPDGRPVVDRVGELVISEPMPCMPVHFWNDPDGSRRREAYFSTFPGVWRHGDWVTFRPDGGAVIYGRSDATLNRGGVRMGTAEFYNVVEAFPEIADSLVIDTTAAGNSGKLILFLTPADGHTIDDGVLSRVKSALRTELSPRHVPHDIRIAPGVPRTLSGKKLEVPVRRIILGTPVDEAMSRDATSDPKLLDWYIAQQA
ncbi:MAG TPA: acetoacetate--CoA ligase [Mycobacteriales bacterium]|nr:acetoacetate--CoA ligase [Mycobacteriales bacterium]